jgi:hypothetical protein
MDTGVVSRARTGRTSRRLTGDRAEEAVAAHLAALGWRILGRNVRVGRCELDIVALDVAGARHRKCARSAPGFRARRIDRCGQVARLYARAGGSSFDKAGHVDGPDWVGWPPADGLRSPAATEADVAG